MTDSIYNKLAKRFGAVLLICWAGFAHAQYDWQDVSRVVAIGDIHGAYDEFTGLLRAVGLVDGDLHWQGGNTHLVSLGDLVDRGAGSKQVMDLLMRLQEQAEAAGGRVHVLLGNHELMNLTGDLRDGIANQGHYFNAAHRNKRLTPAGPDHAQVAAAGAVVDYVAELADHHGIDGSITDKAAGVSQMWRDHESVLLERLMAALVAMPGVRVLGRASADSVGGLHRCPTVALVPSNADPATIATGLAERGVIAR